MSCCPRSAASALGEDTPPPHAPRSRCWSTPSAHATSWAQGPWSWPRWSTEAAHPPARVPALLFTLRDGHEVPSRCPELQFSRVSLLGNRLPTLADGRGRSLRVFAVTEVIVGSDFLETPGCDCPFWGMCLFACSTLQDNTELPPKAAVPVCAPSALCVDEAGN